MALLPRGNFVLHPQPHHFVRQFLSSSQTQCRASFFTNLHTVNYSSSSSRNTQQNVHASSTRTLFSRSDFKFLNWPARVNKRHVGSAPTKDKKLFTPGPLCVTNSVKEVMLRDVGSRDTEFIETIAFIREKLLDIAGVPSGSWTCIPLQGSGTFAVDACFQTFLPREGGKVLVFENGAYGKRMKKICDAAGIECHVQSFREDQKVEPKMVENALSGRHKYNLVSIVHCETSSGVFNPVEEVGKIVHDLMPGAVYLVDAMSSFGAVPVDIQKSHIDAIVSSSNKCLQGVPGFAFVMAKNSVVDKCEGNSRSVSLDLYDQVKQLDKTTQFRFTPPTHAMMAFKKAIMEFYEEGGVEGRAQRYANNRAILRKGMTELGFKELLDDDSAGYIITSYLYPRDPNFVFKTFYDKLNEKDMVIYPGKVLDIDCFRMGNIGDLHAKDMEELLVAIREVCEEMEMSIPLQQ